MLLIYLIVFLIFYRTSNVSERPTFKVILLIYLAGIICACALWYFAPTETRRYDLYFPGIIYHVVILVLMMLPLKKYDRIIAPDKITIPYSTLQPFLVGLVVLSIITILSSFVTYSLIWRSGVSIFEGRQMSFDGESFVRIVKPSGSILAHISCIASEFSYLAFFFAFLVMVKYPGHKSMVRWLLISSLSAIFYQLEWFGRENIVRFFFDGAIVLVMFRSLLTNPLKKYIKKVAIIIAIIFGGIFTLITISRFGEDTGYENGPIYSVLSYMGQGFYYFSPIYEAHTGFEGKSGGRTIFAIFFDEAERGSIYKAADSYSGTYDIPHNVFGTYVCTFVGDLGAIPALIAFAVLIVFFIWVSKRRSDNIFTYIYILWVYRFFTQGVFYWVDILVTGDRIMCFVMILLLDLLYTTKRSQLQGALR